MVVSDIMATMYGVSWDDAKSRSGVDSIAINRRTISEFMVMGIVMDWAQHIPSTYGDRFEFISIDWSSVTHL